LGWPGGGLWSRARSCAAMRMALTRSGSLAWGVVGCVCGWASHTCPSFFHAVTLLKSSQPPMPYLFPGLLQQATDQGLVNDLGRVLVLVVMLCLDGPLSKPSSSLMLPHGKVRRGCRSERAHARTQAAPRQPQHRGKGGLVDEWVVCVVGLCGERQREE
jgi:hypothetical protein